MTVAAAQAQIRETLVSKAIGHIRCQKPRWFSYGSPYFVEHYDECPIPLPAEGQMTPLEAVAIPGDHVLQFAVQLGAVHVDLYPQTVPTCPPEIEAEADHCVAGAAVHIKAFVVDARAGRHGAMREFTLAAWVKLGMCVLYEPETPAEPESPPIHKLRFTLDDLELVDLGPQGMEDLIEDVARPAIEHLVFRNLKLPIEFSAEVPTSPTTHMLLKVLRNGTPPNPSIDGNLAKYVIDLELAEA